MKVRGYQRSKGCFSGSALLGREWLISTVPSGSVVTVGDTVALLSAITLTVCPDVYKRQHSDRDDKWQGKRMGMAIVGAITPYVDWGIVYVV